MFSFSWFRRKERTEDQDKAAVVEMKKRADMARERLNGAVVKLDAMNEMLDDTIRAVGRGRRK